MSRIWWVDNTAGDDGNSGTSYTDAVASPTIAFNLMESIGSPGDSVRICYTGQRYDYTSYVLIDAITTQGYGWGTGEHFTIEGYDPSGGYNRPEMGLPIGANTGYFIAFSGYANYWEIKDLKLTYDDTNTSWGSGCIYVTSAINNGASFFKITNCWLEGNSHLTTSDHAVGIYTVGGGKVYTEISNCFIKNLGMPIRSASSTPSIRGWNIHNCVLYNEDYGPQIYFYGNAAGELLDFTFVNNTQIVTGGTGTYTQTINWLAGDLTNLAENHLEIRNNIGYNNIFFRAASASGTGVSGATDYTDFVGYNAVHSHYAHYIYYNEADVFEIDTPTKSIGDVYLTALYPNFSDLTSLFVDYGNETYFWEASGWMTIPDLRPIASDLTGIYGDPTGIKGALPSGDYKDSTGVITDTSIVCTPAKIPHVQSSTASYLVQINSEEFPTFNYGSLNDGGVYSYFGTHGGSANLSIDVVSVLSKLGNLKVTLSPSAQIEDSLVSSTNIISKTQIKQTGPVDATSPWSSWESGSRTNEVVIGGIAGSYNVYAHAADFENDQTTDWVLVHQYSV